MPQSLLDLDSTYKKYDPDSVGVDIDHLGEQARLAWHNAGEVVFGKGYNEAGHIVVCGMGGSALGAEMFIAALCKKLKLPITINRDDTLPVWVNQDCLVILSSYSGTTAEVLSCATQALKARAKIIVITSLGHSPMGKPGGSLAKLAKSHKWPVYLFDPDGYAQEPRFGLGFALFGLLALLKNLGYLTLTDKEIESCLVAMNDVVDSCAVDIPLGENSAKQVAQALVEKNILLISAEHLTGVGHVFANHCNESAKQFAVPLVLPELHHHFLESLTFPQKHNDATAIILLRSELYSAVIKKRCDLTADLFEKSGASVIEYFARGKTPLEEVCEVLQFACYVTYYLAMHNGVNPRPNPQVDALKKKLFG